MTVVQGRVVGVGQDLWRAQRAFANDSELTDAAQSFAADNLEVALASRSDRGPVVDAARDLVRELFVNATRDRSPLIGLLLTVNRDVLRIDVESHRRGYPSCRPVLFMAPPEGTVQAITRVASRWDCEPTAEGARVWVEIDLA
jgi:hypothetical protein